MNGFLRHDRLERRGRSATKRFAVAFVLILAATAGCAASTEMRPAPPPASLEVVPGGAHHRISLTERAAERLGVQTVSVAAADGPAGANLSAVPYSALLYDADGTTFVYVSPQPLLFVREDVEVERIEGATALLSAGPALGTAVVSVGGAELLGTETEIGH
jgi:hypothetical protein